MAQITYTSDYTKFYPGQIVKERLSAEIASKEVDDSAGLTFGVGVSPTDTQRKKVSQFVDNAAFMGITVYEELAPDSAGDVSVPDGGFIGVMRKGYVAAVSTVTLNPGDAVYLIHTGADKGKFSTSAGAGANGDAVTAVTVDENISSTLFIACVNMP